MAVEQDTTMRRTVPKTPARTHTVARKTSPDSRIADEVLKRLTADGPRFLATAPGRLDVMSGLADYTGALVLQMPLADHICAAVQLGKNGLVTLVVLPGQKGTEISLDIPVKSLVEASQTAVHEALLTPPFVELQESDVRCVLGALVEALRSKIIKNLGDGLTVVVGSTMSALSDVGHESALAAATLTAVAGAMNVALGPADAATMCQCVINDWLALPLGVSDSVCSLVGEPHTVTQLRCDPYTLVGTLRLPESLELIGVHCGTVQKDWLTRYEHARTASYMGRLLIGRIIKHEGGNHSSWEGCLSRISVVDFVERFRDRLPTKLEGADFLGRFGETGDPLTKIRPGVIYKIRSRTEHHIYENARSNQFVGCLAREMRTGDDSILADIRDLMHASHWSYGQRCGLGSVKTDLLTNLIRQHGREAGIVGSRISGRGCGGVVTVLMRTTKQAQDALGAAIEDYEKKTGQTTTILRGSLPGALTSGTQQS